MRQAQLGSQLVSRSQGKWVVERATQLRTVVLDFDGVALVGQEFVDEVFRVFAAAPSGNAEACEFEPGRGASGEDVCALRKLSKLPHKDLKRMLPTNADCCLVPTGPFVEI